MYNLVICGFSEDHNQRMASYIMREVLTEDFNVISFVDVNRFIAYLDRNGQRADIVICRVVMEPYNGIKLMRVVQERLPHLQIIFMSRFKDLVFDSYAVRHVSFLPMPIDKGFLLSAVEMALENIRLFPKLYINLMSHGLISRIPLDDIEYFESNGRILSVKTRRGKLEYTRQLESVKPYLDGRFIQCHKSYMVNMDYVVSIDLNELSMNMLNGEAIPISHRRQSEVKIAVLNMM